MQIPSSSTNIQWNIGRSCRKAVVGSPNQNAENKDKKIKHEETK
jgi:hypothetical protein